jgi:hypothetical protein
VELLMKFLQDLRQAISDREKLDRDTMHMCQVFSEQRLDPDID